MVGDIMKTIAIIPIRSGSKRFPGKNFSSFNGTTLIENTIAKLIKAKIDEIIISTDVPKKVKNIIGLSIKSDNLKIISRSPELAQDNSKIEDVILDVVENIPGEDFIIILAQITSPNWNPHSLMYAINKLEDKKVNSIVSVSPDYKPNGCFYIIKKSTFLLYKKLYLPNMYLIDLNWKESTDIDFEYQLYIAEAIARGNTDD